MKIYTRHGDRGETGLFGGQRVRKDSGRIQALGAIDEVNAALGLAHALGPEAEIAGTLRGLQENLMELGADIALPGAASTRITPETVAHLESTIDRYEAGLEPLRNFILPGGTPAAAALHAARGVCRRAERCLVSLAEEESLPDNALAFVNRLSDLLFVLARAANSRAGVGDPVWRTR